MCLLLSSTTFAQGTEYNFGPGQMVRTLPLPNGNIRGLFSHPQGIAYREIDSEGTTVLETLIPSTPGAQRDYATGWLPLADGGMLILGLSQAESFSHKDALVIRLQADGQIIWSKVIEQSSAYYGAYALEDGFLLTGWYDPPGASNDGKITRIDASGNVIWDQTVEVGFQTYVRQVFPATGQEVVVAGRYSFPGSTPDGVFLRRISVVDGSEIWTQTQVTYGEEETYFTGGPRFEEFMGGFQRPNGDIWLATHAGYALSQVEVLAFNLNGTLLSSRRYGDFSRDDIPYEMIPLADGDLLITGSSARSNLPTGSAFALRVKPSGQPVWTRHYAVDQERFRITGATETADGDLYLAAASGQQYEVQTARLLRTEADGHLEPYRISGYLRIDLDGDCFVSPDAPSLFGLIRAGDGRSVHTDETGFYTLYTDQSSPILTVDHSWTVCNGAQTVTLNPDSPLAEADFILQPPAVNCPDVSVQVVQPSLRRCATGDFWVEVRNDGFADAPDQVVEVHLPPEMSLVEADPMPDQLEPTLRFDLGTVGARSGVRLKITATLDCEVQLGATHPIRATLDAAACAPAYGGGWYRLMGQCNSSVVEFAVNNPGAVPTGETTFRIYADHRLLHTETGLDLGAGQSESLQFPADGRTWRMEVDQPEGYPFGATAERGVEGCGTNNARLASTDWLAAHPDLSTDPTVTEVFPRNHILLRDNSINLMRHLHGLYRLTDTLVPTEFSVLLENPNGTPAQEVSVELFPNAGFDPASLEILTILPHSVRGDGTSVVLTFPEANVPPQGTFGFNLRLTPRADLPADAQAESLLSLSGNGYFDCVGPVELTPAYFNHTVSVDVTDANDYETYDSTVHRIGGSLYSFGTHLTLDDDRLYLGGETSSFSKRQYTSAFLARADTAGRVAHQRAINVAGGREYNRGILLLADRTVLAFGSSRPLGSSAHLPNYASHRMRLDPDGQQLDYELFWPNGPENGVWVDGVVPQSGGGGLVYGRTISTTSYDTPYYRKYDAQGNVEWTYLDQTSTENRRPFDVVQHVDGSYGILQSVDYDEVQLLTLSTQGGPVQVHELFFSETVPLNGLCAATDGPGYLLFGDSFHQDSLGDYVIDLALVRVDANGEELWLTHVPNDTMLLRRTEDGVALPDGNGYVFTGQAAVDHDGAFNHQLNLLRVGETGEKVWDRTFGNPLNAEDGRTVAVSEHGYIYAYGFNQPRPPAYHLRSLLVRTDLNGDVPELVTRVREPMVGQTLVFPNPATDWIRVALSPAPVGRVDWEVLSMNGRTLRRGVTRTGVFTLDLGGMAAGMYVLRFPNGAFAPQRIVVQ